MPNDDADMSAVGSRRGAIDAELLYPRLERGALEAQAGGGPLRTSEHPVGLAQRAENGLALRCLERGGAPRRRDRATAQLRPGHAKGGPARQDDGALDGVLELPHVSRPGIARERRHGVGGDGLDALVHATRELLHEVSDERRNVLWPLAERWKRDREDVQAIVQIVPERAGGDHLFEVPVRGCDYSDVDALRTRATEPLELPLLEHPKLLRVLQEREFERLGSTRTKRVDVRVVAATNRNLEEMVAAGTFRNDLYYRLDVFPITLPPLRERPEDIPHLVRYFAQKFARRMKKRIDTIPGDAMAALCRYAWPGNVRELENAIERAVILTSGPALCVAVSEFHARAVPASGGTLEATEREAIVRRLRESNWVLGGPHGAAARLGLKRTTLQSRMRKLGIRRDEV